MSESLDIAAPLRAAIIGDDASGGVAELLPLWESEPAVFTRRPVPATAPLKMILVNPEVGITDMDSLSRLRPVCTRDIIVYGLQPDDYRSVEVIAFRLRTLFHRRKQSITVSGYHVIDITVIGPFVAPTDDANEVARGVTVTVRLGAVG